MKIRITLLILLTTILSACNMSLAEDVTPPPGYIPPTPIPTLVLVPPQMPNVQNGEAIYFEKCAACHGDTGLGDGEQGIQLGVTVPAFALSEIARPASPATWYTTVTRGRIERFMPPFASLNDQERWDVVAYIMTLHTSQEEIKRGRKIFEENCADCSTDFYKDRGKMSGLSTVELARIVRLGNQEIKAFGENLPDEDMWAVAEYLRSLTYETSSQPPDTALENPTPAPASVTPSPAGPNSPLAEATPAGTEQTMSADGFGTVKGNIDNQTGDTLPVDLTVTLRGYEHDFANPSVGPQEVITMKTTIVNDETFSFENVEIPEGRIFLAEITFGEIEYSSDFAVVEAGQTSVTLPPLVIYRNTRDFSGLIVDELDIFITTTTEGTYEILSLYSFRNTGDSVVYVDMKDSQEIPFLKFPSGTQPLGYEALQDSAPFTSTSDGFAMPPNEIPYGIIAFSSVAIEKEIDISQPITMPVSFVRVLVPDGMEADGAQLMPDSPQDIQGDMYQTYYVNGIPAGDVLSFTVSGAPNTQSGQSSAATPNSTLLIGAGGLGIALILAGAWMYLQDRTHRENEEDEDDEGEFETPEDVMDAIIALDDLHRANKISDKAYKNRRAELKDILKEMV